MRGIETGKARIRHDVFTEIARMAYEGGDYAKRLEELPFKIIPGEIGTYRDSLFLERAVVGERLRLAMGLPLRKFSEYSLLSEGIEKAPAHQRHQIRLQQMPGQHRHRHGCVPGLSGAPLHGGLPPAGHHPAEGQGAH